MSDHKVELVFEGDECATATLICEAPATEPCHAEWACDCTEWADYRVSPLGLPQHLVGTWGGEKFWHTGTFKDGCNLQDWFTATPHLDGTLTVPVEPIWEHYCYKFQVGGGAA